MKNHSNFFNENSPYKFLLKVATPYKWWYLLIIQAGFVNAIYPIIYNYAIKLLIDLFTENAQITVQMATWPVFLFIFCNILLEICWRIHNFAAWRMVPHISQDIMDKVFTYIIGHSYQFFQNNLSGSIISKIKGINDGFFKIHKALEYQVSKPILTAFFTGTALAFVSPEIFMVVIIFAIINTPIAIYCYSRLNKIEEKAQESWHKVIGLVADNISNIFTLFAFAAKKKERQEINRYYDEVYKPRMFAWHKYDFWMSCSLMLIHWVFMSCLFIYMIYLKNNNQISTGDIAFIMSMTYLFTYNIWESLNSVKDFSQNLAQFKVSFSIMAEDQNKIDKPDAVDIKVNKGEINFKNVSFAYNESLSNNSDVNYSQKPEEVILPKTDDVDIKGLSVKNETGVKLVLKNLNLNIKPGEKIGLVGSSGAGKSTFVSLLLKNFKADSGDIIIDGQSIYDVSSESLASFISLIPQDIMLFHRSIGENIAYAKEGASLDEIQKAAKAANIHDFIIGLPHGYNTIVGERGIKLSGGQRQRIAIARAILKNSPILILDEATSSLDSHTESEIQKSINLMLETNKATVIAIAHRLSTIKHMDRIIVMDKGEIQEEGSFNELLAKDNGKFKELWEHQAGGMIV